MKDTKKITIELTEDECALIEQSLNGVFQAGMIKGNVNQVATLSALATSIIVKLTQSQQETA